MSIDILNRTIEFGGEKFTPLSFDENSITMDWECAKGGSVPPHFHRHMDEHFTIIKGEVTFRVNGEKAVKRVGETLLVPRMTPHSIKNNSCDSIGLRVTYTPNADVHKMFSAFAMFQDEGNSLMTIFMKWLYVQDKLQWKKFSEPAPAIGRGIFAVFGALANLLGGIFGWRKYLDKFNN